MTTPSLRVLVLQHSPVDHPGSFTKNFLEDGHQLETIRLDNNEALPNLDNYQLIWIMGGPQDTWQEAQFPWLKAEKNLIREAYGRKIPIMGFCLGAQLIADALGGKVAGMKNPEFGMGNVELVFHTLHWHAAEIIEIPAEGQTLARTRSCLIQAFRVGKLTYGIQFHMELTEDTVSEWLSYESYRKGIEEMLGRAAPEDLVTITRSYAHECRSIARVFYKNYIRILGH
jgi:GMP synthase-like glutamine amidotransferase